ncbi:MAG: nicotinate phosphoribosyltransferase [Longimicrobiales bacterium]|nr:nicotinate phosphoribosyltransferase [Longimicrobiales bacterium]
MSGGGSQDRRSRRDGARPGFLGREDTALLVDQYELTMLQAYWAEEMTETAVFSLFVRRLPEGRNYLLGCGIETVLAFLEDFRFSEESIRYLRGTETFDDDFLTWLAELRFTGSVRAVPEGTPIFPDEPILEIEAPMPEAQVLETFVMNQVHVQTVLASKAARVKTAAGHRTVADFGLRRMHGADAGLLSARAFHVAGLDSTSNVLAGKIWGVPVTGTMAHSYIQAHGRELRAFRAFAETFPETILLVDTYDTLDGVRKVVRLAEELGEDFRVRGIRLDSGDLCALARESRRILDAGGLHDVKILASGGLDEWEIRRLVAEGAPIDGFGVGTGMGVAKDAPSLDMAYKLTSYAGRGRLKLSPGKRTLPGPKQVFRRTDAAGRSTGDVIARAAESLPGRPLLRTMMTDGRRTGPGESLEDARARARRELESLPPPLLELKRAEPPYPVEVSGDLERYTEEVTDAVRTEATEEDG